MDHEETECPACFGFGFTRCQDPYCVELGCYHSDDGMTPCALCCDPLDPLADGSGGVEERAEWVVFGDEW